VRVLVTGGSGFLGGHVVPLLVEGGHMVAALARSPRSADRVAALGAVPVPGDLDDPASVDQAFAASGATALVSLASLGFGHAGAVIAAAEEAGLKRAVFVSTTSVFTALEPPSKAVRLEAEDAVRASDLDWTIVRPTMIYGTPADRNMARLLQLLRRSPVVPVPGGGHKLQQPVHVDDLAQAVVAALLAPAAIGRAYNLGGPEALTFRQHLEQAAAAAGRRPRLVPVPLGPGVAALRLYERMARTPRLKAEQLERLAEDKAFDIEPARRELGFRPRPFAEGIRHQSAMLA
jgi:nucleoside-diphosphate-sugar epimerase